jgi:hypothetical protein
VGRFSTVLLILAVVAVLALTAHSAIGETASSSAPRYLVAFAANPAERRERLEVLNSAGRLVRVVASGLSTDQLYEPARWSPDGSMLAWLDAAGVNVAHADGTAKRLLAPLAHPHLCNPCFFMSFAWSPDGRFILVGGAGFLTRSLAVVSVAGGRSRIIAKGSEYDQFIALGWANDGRSVVFAHVNGDAWSDIDTAAADGSRRRVLYRNTYGRCDDCSAPVLAPDGHAFAWALVSYPSGSAGPSRTDLSIVDVSTARVQNIDITEVGTGLNGRLAWTADSRSIALGFARKPVTLVRAGTGAAPRSLGILGAPFPATSGDVLIFRGTDNSELWTSSGGHAAHLIFRAPTDGIILGADAR